MKSTASMQTTGFFNSPSPFLPTWGEAQPKISRRSAVRRASSLDPDEFAASKQEVICCVILALCLVFTVACCAAQMIS